MTKQLQLDELEKLIKHQQPCKELASSAKQLVFGCGDTNADVVFVGEAPGKKEDESGMPFVGASGRFLDEMLASINMKRENVYITNIVKYRPPNNRDPRKEEKAEFWPYLLEQLMIIKPKIIATLGRHSGQVFIPDLHIGADHGEPKSIKIMHKGCETSLLVIPLYHPAAALYNGALRKIQFQDFLNIPKLIHEN